MPLAVWGLCALQALLLLAHSELAPIWRAPDEPHHMDMVLEARTGQGWPGPDERNLSLQITETFPRTGFAFQGVRDLPPLRAGDAPPRGGRPTFAEVAEDEPSGARNWLQHPPLYYVVVASWLTVTETLVPGAGGWSFDRTVAVARLLNVLVVLWLPLLAWATAARAGLSRRVGLTAGAAVLVVPQMAHIGATVNNDNLIVLLVGLATVLVAGIVRGDLRRRTAVGVGLLVGLALLTKGLALFALVWLPLAYGAAAWLGRRPPARADDAGVPVATWRTAGSRAALSLLAAAVGGGWWLVRNVVVAGSVQPASLRSGPPDGFTPDAGAWGLRFARWIVERWWGSFGWYQAQLPRVLVWTGAALLTAAVVAALVRADARSRLRHLVLLAPTAGLLLGVAWGAWGLYADTGNFAAIQGRYLLPGLTGLAVVAAAGLAALTRDSRWLPLAVFGMAVVWQGAGVLTALRRFWEPGALLAWSSWPAAVHGAVAVLGVSAVGGTVWLLVREAGTPDRPAAAVRRSSAWGDAAIVTVGAWLRGIPAAVWLLVATQLLVGVGYAVLVPTWRAPDEPQHADMVFAVRHGGGWPDIGERRLTAQIIHSYEHAQFDFEGRKTEPPLEALDAVARGARPTFAGIAPDDNIGSRNGQFQHPPLYYVTAATTMTAVTSLVPGAGRWSYDQIVVLLRCTGTVLMAALPLLGFLVARRLRARRPVALAAAAFPLLIPQLAHIGATVNSDALLVPAASAATLGLVHLALGDLRRRTVVLTGLACGVALFSKGLALFLPLMAVGACVLAARHRGVGRAARSLLLVGAVAFVAGGWWWLRNLLRYGSVQPTGAFIPPAPEGFAPSFVEWLQAVVTLVPPRFWGSFGWSQVTLPGAAVWPATALVVVAVVAALVLGPRTGRAAGGEPPGGERAHVPVLVGRRHLLLLLVPVAGTAAIVGYGAYGYYVASSLTPALQGRYLFSGVVGLGAVAAFGASALLRGRDRALVAAVLAGAAVLHLVSVAALLDRFYGIAGVRDPAASVAGFLAWSPWPRWALTAVAVGIVLSSGWAVILMLRGGRGRPGRGQVDRGHGDRRATRGSSTRGAAPLRSR